MKLKVNRHHGGIRSHRYPAIGDQMDAIWKAIQLLAAQGIDIGQDAREMLSKVQAVKSETPKIEGAAGLSVVES